MKGLKAFFGVIVHGQSWLNLLYLLLCFPFGLFYFVFLTVGLSIGIGLAIIWVGIPILLVMVAAWWGFAAFERLQARYLLGVAMPPSPRPWEQGEGVLGRLRAHFGSASTWKDLVFLLLKFPLGVAAFAVTVALMAAADALLFAPLYYHSGSVINVGINIGPWHVDRLWQALILVPTGFLALIISLHIFNAAAGLFRVIASALLAENGPMGAAGTPAQPVAPAASLFSPSQGDDR
jgi:hypothetical protein